MLNRHRPHRPLLAGAAALTVLAAVAAGPTAAEAASEVTPNACLYSWDNYYRDLDITLTGSATPNPLPPGEAVTLTASLSGTMPVWLPTYGYNLDLLTVGENRIPTTMLVAIEGVGSVEQVQVVKVSFDALTTVTDPDGTPRTNDEGGTPPIVDVQLDPTTWTSAGGPIELRQASGATLTSQPDLGPDGGPVTPEGSIYISSSLSPELRFNLDCQPGEQVAADRGETYTAAQAKPFETVTVAEPAAEVPTTTAPAPTTTTAAPTTTAPLLDLAPTGESSDTSGGSNAALIIAIVALVLLAIGGVIWFVVRGRNAAAVDPAAAPDTDAPEPDAPGPDETPPGPSAG